MSTEENLQVSVILPCQNEEGAIGESILKIKAVFEEHQINGEIIVSDSSTDMSPVIARDLGVVLVKHDKEGYGRAFMEGFKHSRGKYIFCADPDGTYDFEEIPRFIKNLQDGFDLVIGNRFKGKIASGAMSRLRYIGNIFLSFIFRVLFKTRKYDVHCGMRAITKQALNNLELKTPGMEFATEMVAKAVKNNLKIKELSINYSQRIGYSKLESFRDGWRHLRFMFLHSLII